MLSAAAFTRPEQLPLNIDIASVNRETAYREFREMAQALTGRPARRVTSVEMTPSDLSALDGCFRYFHWTRLLGLAEPGTPAGRLTENTALQLGSAAHEILEYAREPSLDLLKEKALPDLEAVFQSAEWKALAGMDVARELPFIMHVTAGGRDCFVRGRMDAVVSGQIPRVIDYKYALWTEGAEMEYEIQMAAYCLAVMKRLGAERAIAELWYLKAPMKIVKWELQRADAEHRIAALLGKYLDSLSFETWPMAERSYCDSIACGFRERCWAQ
jgi:CRISPR/Cas system-associated exonuclease Cas4 (RecB family)